MNKCDFCAKLLPNGRCWWSGIAREDDCNKAIKRMMKVLKSNKIHHCPKCGQLIVEYER